MSKPAPVDLGGGWFLVGWSDRKGDALLKRGEDPLLVFPVGCLAAFGVTLPRLAAALTAYRDLHGMSDPVAVAHEKRRKARRRSAKARLRERESLAAIRGGKAAEGKL
jgi:hypothetical protein